MSQTHKLRHLLHFDKVFATDMEADAATAWGMGMTVIDLSQAVGGEEQRSIRWFISSVEVCQPRDILIIIYSPPSTPTAGRRRYPWGVSWIGKERGDGQ